MFYIINHCAEKDVVLVRGFNVALVVSSARCKT